MSPLLYINSLGASMKYKSAAEVTWCSTTPQDFDPNKEKYGAIVVDASIQSHSQSLLKKIRQSEKNFLCPVFYNFDENNDLIDGIVNDEKHVLTLLDKIKDRIDSISKDNRPTLISEKILFYMYSRQKFTLKGTINWKNRFVAEYPLALLFDESVDSWEVVFELYRSHLLKRSNLSNRIQSCPSCHTGLINYCGRCPACRSLNIEKKRFIHCYTCGHVAPQEEFVKNHSLICKECETILRQIGSDYDRPLENHFCKDCHEQFSEPEILAECLFCEIVNEPENLETREVYDFSLSDRGWQIVKGRSVDMFKSFDSLNIVDGDIFYSILNWMREMQERYKEMSYSIVGIEICNASEIENSLGIVASIKLFDEFANRIRSHLRTTDITMRSNDNLLWLLLPKTSVENDRVLLERLLKSVDDKKIKINTCVFNSFDDNDTVRDAKKLIEHLNHQLG